MATEQSPPCNGLFEQQGPAGFRGHFFVRFREENGFARVDIIAGEERDYSTEIRITSSEPEDISPWQRRHFAKIFGHDKFEWVEAHDAWIGCKRFTGLRIVLYGRLNWCEGGIEQGKAYDFLLREEGAPKVRPAAGGGAGLFKAHIRPYYFRDLPRQVTVYRDGQLLEVEKVAYSEFDGCPGRRGGGNRGGITSFSRQSRMRLLKAVCRLELVPEECLFVTLTYPKVFPSDAETIKRDYETFVKRLRRSMPEISGYSKVEPQKRGAPHWHLLLFGNGLSPEQLRVLRKWVAHTWFEVVGSGDEKHLKAGTQVKIPQTIKGTLAYLSKYLGKVCDGLPNGMRYWRVINRQALPWSEKVTVELTDEEGIQLKRLLKRLLRAKVRSRQRRRFEKEHGRSIPFDWVMGHIQGQGVWASEELNRLRLLLRKKIRRSCREWQSFRTVIGNGGALLRLVEFVRDGADPPPF